MIWLIGYIVGVLLIAFVVGAIAEHDKDDADYSGWALGWPIAVIVAIPTLILLGAQALGRRFTRWRSR